MIILKKPAVALFVAVGMFLFIGVANSQNLPRILVFSKTLGFRHASIADGVAAIQKLGNENNFLVDTTTNAAYFRGDSLSKYAAVVFLSTTGNVLNDEQQLAFERYIETGGGFAGIHAAADTEYDWPWYNRLLGAYFLNHPAQQTAVVVVQDKDHPSSSMLPTRWQRYDEWYNFRNIMPGIRVLATLDESTYTGGVHGENHPIAWYQNLGCGRSWYTALGHTRESFSESLFLQHLLGGLRFAMGNGQACSTLPVVLTEFEATLTRNKQVMLNWQTAHEQNSDHFVVERSADLRSFTAIATLQANGRPSVYTYRDNAPLRGQNYYRLRQVDKDGIFQYTNTAAVRLSQDFSLLVSPNPSKGIVQVTTGTGERLLITVTDITGRIRYRGPHQGPNFSVDLSPLSAGSYIIHVDGAVRRFVLVK